MNTNSKLRVALFFGGVSSEHDVSCVSASAWLRALGQEPCADKYEVFPVGITKDGRWLACRPTPETMADGSWEQGDCTPCVLSPDRKDHGIWLLKDGRAELVHIDICAPVMHGKNGEDGTIAEGVSIPNLKFIVTFDNEGTRTTAIIDNDVKLTAPAAPTTEGYRFRCC